MQDRNDSGTHLNRPSDMAGKGKGPDGVDKAPGEETSQDTENVVANTQKGKNKVDGDPSNPADQPIGNE